MEEEEVQKEEERNLKELFDESDTRAQEIFIEMMTQKMLGFSFLNNVKKITFNNSEIFFSPIATFIEKNKKKMELKALKIQSYMKQKSLSGKLINQGFRDVIESSLKYSKLKSLAIQWSYLNK